MQRIQTWKIDDVDGESAANETVAFALDGVEYEIDLTTDNANKLRGTLQPWRQGGRRVRGRGRKPVSSDRRTAQPARIDPSQARAIRDWAATNGYTVSARGKIPAAVHEAFEAAHN